MSTPWWADNSWKFVESKINRKSIVFEWGSGGSTRWLSKISSHIISIENDQNWYNQLKALRVPNVDIKYIPHDGDSKNDPADAYGYTSKSRDFGNKDFTSYVKSIDAYPDGHFNLIIIDGRSRTSCIAHSIKKLSKNGLLLIDDLWRKHYASGIDLIPKNWQRTDFKSEGKFTGIWINVS